MHGLRERKRQGTYTRIIVYFSLHIEACVSTRPSTLGRSTNEWWTERHQRSKRGLGERC